MSDFVNTVDAIGDDALMDQLIQKTVTEFKDNVVTTIRDNALNSCPLLEEVSFPSAKKTGYFAFCGCTSLKTAVFQAATEVSESSFSGCSSLEEVSVPKATKISTGGFNACAAMQKVDFPLVTTLGANAFKSCTSLTEVNLPLVTSIPSKCFDGCTSLGIDVNSTTFPSVTSIAGYAFMNSGIKTVDFPAMTQLSGDAIRGAANVTSVNFPMVETINNRTFMSCDSLTLVNIPKATSLGGSVFAQCKSLEILDLPRVTSIGSYCFGESPKLKTVILRSDTMCTLAAADIFNNSGTGQYIYVPSALVDTYKADSVWSTYADQIRAIEDYADELFLTQDGLVLNYDYRGHQDDTSTTIVDLASGVTASNFDQFGKNENGIYGKGTYKYLVLNVADEAGLAFIEAMKSGEGFTTETFGSYSGEDFFFGGRLTAYGSDGIDVAGGIFVKNGTSVPRILTDGSSAKTDLEMERVITLDGEDVDLSVNMQVSLAKIPNRSNFLHVVTTYSPNGTIRRWINGAPFKTPYQVENFKAWDYDTMFAASAAHLPSMRNAYYYSASTDYMSCHRVYNRVLSEAEIKANMTASAAKIGLLL